MSNRRWCNYWRWQGAFGGMWADIARVASDGRIARAVAAIIAGAHARRGEAVTPKDRTEGLFIALQSVDGGVSVGWNAAAVEGVIIDAVLDERESLAAERAALLAVERAARYLARMEGCPDIVDMENVEIGYRDMHVALAELDRVRAGGGG